ncbi:MAG TPA: acetylxylan esterase, partial [Pirellulaceae bacterium]|nr:acetylxylan esterase [Pirellulaceae bacterium]
MNRTYLLLVLLFTMLYRFGSAEDLRCLSEVERASAALYSHLQQDAYAALDRRGESYEQLKTPEQIQEYQQRLREFFTRQLGGFPERTPLNAKTVRTIQADGYRIELVIYESQPRHRVSANLYIPDGDGPFPGVVVSSGHSRTGKTADYNQRFGIMLAKHGMAALCFDPIGQGERSQILDDQGNPKYSGTTTEHFLIGVGSTLVGRSTATYRAWDGIRSIDYLVSRPEIDPARIGYTGCSGGGTLTSYVMALDERVTCAAPACYLTTFRRLIETIGPQDAEQNIFGQIAFGLDQPDYV